MRKLYYGLLLAVVLGMFAPLASAQQQGKKMQVYGVAFYNLENLFDTINNNGKYDKEFSPAGKNQWDSRRYWKKINNLGYAISQMPTRSTPMGPAVIGVSEVENITVLQDLVRISTSPTGTSRSCTTTRPTVEASTSACSTTHASSRSSMSRTTT